MADYGVYFGPRNKKCGECGKRLQDQDGYVRVYINRYANPYFHANCLRKMVIEVEKHENKSGDLWKKHQEKIAAAQAIKKAKKNKKGFSRQIIKDALKAVGVKVSACKFRNATWRDERHHEIEAESGQDIWVSLIDDKAYVSARSNGYSYEYFWKNDWKTKPCIPLADPNALELLGKEILKANPNFPMRKQKTKKVKI
jgi:hypothetical protein